MMQKTYDWMMRMAAHRRAPHALFWVSFAESSVFPIPPDIMLVPMVLADRTKAWWFATVATVASVIGGVAGYAIGYYLLEAVRHLACDALDGSYPTVVVLVLNGLRSGLGFLCPGGAFEQVGEWFKDWGVWILIAKGWTPIPYKVLTIAAGAFHMALVPFVLASIVARAMRFYLVAGLLYWFGEPIRAFIEQRLSLVTTAFVVSLIGGFVVIKYLIP